MKVARLCRVGGELLEGPSWVDGRVRCVDIFRAQLLELPWGGADPARTNMPETVSAWVPRTGGGSAVAARSGLILLDAQGREEGRVGLEEDLPANRSNDAKCDPAGRLWLGTMPEDGASPAGGLYRVAGGHAELVLTGCTISNGLGWSPAGERLYYVDSPTRRIDVLDFDIASGAATHRRPLVDVAHLPGVPDGLAVDVEGALWVAFHDGGAVHRFAADGEHLSTIEVPVARPTSCAFAGPELDRLVITTATAPDGSGGDLLVADPGVRGQPVAAFAG